MTAATGEIILRAVVTEHDGSTERRTLTRTGSGPFVVTRGDGSATKHLTLWEGVTAFGTRFWTLRQCEDTYSRIVHHTVLDLMSHGWTRDGAFAHVEGTCDRAICCGWDD